MAESDGPRAYAHLDVNTPIAPWRMDRQVRELAAAEPSVIVDIGCGWGELLRRLAQAAPAARCIGIDNDAELLARARRETAERELAGRVTFVEADAATWSGPAADLVVCIGASHAFGGTADALRALHQRMTPGGRLLFADGFWERPPTAADLASLWEGATADECTDLAGLVDLAITAGFRPVRVEAVERSEWDDFESQFLADLETWLLENPDAPRAEQVREQADRHRAYWLRGHRGLLGYAYLTLGRPVAARH